MSANTIILDPTAPRANSAVESVLGLTSLEGKVVGFIDNAKPNFNHLVDAMAEQLVAEHGVARVVKQRKRAASIPAERKVLDEIAAECDLVITGSGD
jgi:hypothetical protein